MMPPISASELSLGASQMPDVLEKFEALGLEVAPRALKLIEVGNGEHCNFKPFLISLARSSKI